MIYEILEYTIKKDGTTVKVYRDNDSYIANVSKTVNLTEIEFSWKYEARSLQAVKKWLNKVTKEPLPYKYYESGIWFLPHNEGFGNPDGKRRTLTLSD